MRKEQEKYFKKLQCFVEQAYLLFSKYELPSKNLDVCTFCCTTKEGRDHLINTPIKNIEVWALQEYGTSSHSKQTPLNEFKYFLPKFLDFILQGEFIFIHQVHLFDRVADYAAQEWTDAEKEILQKFAEAYICYKLWFEDEIELHDEVATYLCMFQICLFNVDILEKFCLNHPSTFSLIDYATQIVSNGYNQFFYKENGRYGYALTISFAERLRRWKTDYSIQHHFITLYYSFIEKGYTFDQGNSIYVQQWIDGVERGEY